MAHFAKIEDGIVTNVIVADPEVIASGIFGDNWIQTSYNTRGGVHYDPITKLPSADQTKALRKNYAGIGDTYDSIRDCFIPKKPFPSWLLDSETCLWQPPIPYPEDDRLYHWNELNLNWELSPYI